MIGQSVAFRPVYCELAFTPDVGIGTPSVPMSAASCASQTVDLAPGTSRRADTPGATVLLTDINRNARFVLGPADLTGADLSGAWTDPYGGPGRYETVIGFTAAGSAAFDRVAAARTAAAAGSSASEEAIDVNGQVVSFAGITSPAYHGCLGLVAHGGRGLSRDDAANLAAEIQAAAHLPAGVAPGACSNLARPFTLTAAVTPGSVAPG